MATMEIKEKAIMELKQTVKEYLHVLGLHVDRAYLEEQLAEKVATMLYDFARAKNIDRSRILQVESEQIQKWILTEMGRLYADP